MVSITQINTVNSQWRSPQCPRRYIFSIRLPAKFDINNIGVLLFQGFWVIIIYNKWFIILYQVVAMLSVEEGDLYINQGS